jgi:hypothetical protein
MSDAGIKNLWSFSSTPHLCLHGVYLGTTVLYLNLVQGGSYLCWLVDSSVLHGEQCTAGYEAHTNFANESAFLMAGGIWN